MGEEFLQETKAAHDARETAEAHLGALKDKQAQMAEQVKQALQEKASAEAGLKTIEKQAEGLRKELHSFPTRRSSDLGLLHLLGHLCLFVFQCT